MGGQIASAAFVRELRRLSERTMERQIRRRSLDPLDADGDGYLTFEEFSQIFFVHVLCDEANIERGVSYPSRDNLEETWNGLRHRVVVDGPTLKELRRTNGSTEEFIAKKMAANGYDHEAPVLIETVQGVGEEAPVELLNIAEFARFANTQLFLGEWCNFEEYSLSEAREFIMMITQDFGPKG